MEFKAYLNQKYQGYDSFIENIIYPIFGKDRYSTAYNGEILNQIPELRPLAERSGISSVIYCGDIDLEDNPVRLFDITVKDKVMMERNRVAVQTVVKRSMETYSGAFMLIHYEQSDKWDWRFTFCQLKDKGEYTDSKRYTFLLGPNQACTTAAQNFIKLAAKGGDIEIGDIVKAFDVEALSDEFFGKYKAHYEAFVEYITGKRYEGKDEKVIHDPHPFFASLFGSDDKAVRDYVKLLLGRITFLHFLQKKGWLGVPENGEWGTGDEQFMLNQFEKASPELKDDFVVSVLNPLFFDALDCDRTGKKDVFDSKVFGRIRVPYLNGGMFEKANKDSVAVKWPAEYFGKLLRFFSEYNFTIDENDPNEAQVGVDPEMLGKIFENLLEDNKDKGAFYTPKEIVKYMCQESLIAYLKTKTGFDEKLLRDFVHSPEEGKAAFSEDQQYVILDAILNVKICDPAIGSGAFPIGLLNELVWCKEAIYGDKKGRAEIKREIIRDNIYGVDFDRNAVDIARLRFWLSLIVDEERPVALPNLDYKIMQGNSLLEWYQGVDLSKLSDIPQMADMFDGSLQEDLQKELKAYYECSDHEQKAVIKKRIVDITRGKLKTYENRGRYGDKHIDMTSIDVAENNRFFLWHTWFKDVFDAGGFDIIAGNPPYISAPAQVDNPSLNQQRQDIIATGKYKSLYQKWDLYIPFMELGLQFLHPNGVLTMIVPFPFTNQGYGEKLRDMFISSNEMFSIVDLNGTKIFQNATVSNCIPFVMKRIPVSSVVKVCHICEDKTIQFSHYTAYVDLVQGKKRVWNLSEGAVASNEKEAVVLGDLCYVSKGMVINADEKTARKEFTKDDLISDIQDSIHSRRYVEAKDVEQYKVKRYRWLEWNTTRCPNQLSRPTFRELYDVNKLIFNCLGTIKGTLDEEHYLHNHSLYCMVLWKDLKGTDNKSISSSIKRYSRKTRDEMEALSEKVSLKYLLALLNTDYVNNALAEQRGGDYHIYPEHLRQISIPIIPKEEQKHIEDMVDVVVVAKANHRDDEAVHAMQRIEEIVRAIYESKK